MVTNPLDAMAMQAFKVSEKKPNKIFGMAGVLDSARFTTFNAACIGFIGNVWNT